jgi:hypothetical protein
VSDEHVSDDASEPIARELERRGLAIPALLMLQAHRPLRPLLSLGASFLLPIARPLLGSAAADAARTLDDERAYDRLLRRLRRGARA